MSTTLPDGHASVQQLPSPGPPRSTSQSTCSLASLSQSSCQIWSPYLPSSFPCHSGSSGSLGDRPSQKTPANDTNDMLKRRKLVGRSNSGRLPVSALSLCPPPVYLFLTQSSVRKFYCSTVNSYPGVNSSSISSLIDHPEIPEQ